ncbi:MAG TPA: NUDIX domain-containing protein [Chryseolinea sp.]|nr:NUDIX domain-containing protein [Chryseolinea sp.]HPM30519.1 NUDIX domain-containing protein [Chryseolinea sp.]
MILFVNDIPVRLLKADEVVDSGSVNFTIDAAKEPITPAKLIHHVWVKRASTDHFDELLGFLNSKTPTNLFSLIVSVNDYDAIKEFLRGKFKIVKAAGGLVRKKEKFLMIYRMKKWDLPKGKQERGEKSKQTAVREVEEECNVSVKLGKKICTTWHTYTMNKSAMLKKTRWYVMDVADDAKMKPQAQEDIEEVRWMNRKEVYHALEHSYKSISHVVEQYYGMKGVKSK